MPFSSQKQWLWAFATGQDFARRWAKETPGGKGARFRTLPTYRTKRRKAEMLLAEKAPNYGARAGGVITGNLARGGDGKFASAGNARAATPNAPRQRPRAAAKKPNAPGGGAGTSAQREQERQQRVDALREQRTENRDTVARDAGLGSQLSDALLEFASPDEKIMLSPQNAAALEQRGLVERDRTGEYRMTAAGRAYVQAADSGDVRRAADAISAGTDRRAAATERETAKRARAAAAIQRQAEKDQRRKEAEDKKQQGGGGGGASKPDEEQKRADGQAKKQRTADATGPQVSPDVTPEVVASLRTAAEGRPLTDSTAAQTLSRLGLLGTDGIATDQGRRVLSALERGDVRQAQAALQDARARLQREVAQRARAARRTKAAMAPDSAIKVYKAADGRWWWVARSSTAFQDKDREIVSTAALHKAVARMKASGSYGPLRFWHMTGDDTRPALDIGDCTGSAVVGRTLLEWGTFRSPVFAQMVKASDELSLGFGYHPHDRTPDGVFDDIVIDERSICPAGTARNYFTGVAVGQGTHAHEQA